MKSKTTITVNWKYSFLLLAFIYTILYLLHTRILHKLLIGNHNKIRLKKSANLPLQFKYDGTFKILQVADMHYGMGAMSRCRDVLDSMYRYCSDLNTTLFLERMIEAEKPDLIVFTGDNIFGSSTTDAAESLFQAFGPAMDSGLPWAAILGNHDQESTLTRPELMSLISLMDYSVSQPNPAGVTKKIDGFGNYNLMVHGAPGSSLANNSLLNLFLMDSGDRETVQGIRTYGWIRESQLDWVHSISQELQGQNQDVNHLIPALAFFHIPIFEVHTLYNKDIIGNFLERVACSFVKTTVLETFISMGDVKAVFMGHDHTNDFCGNLGGIWFCYGGGFGYHGYGKSGLPRRGRVILAELGKGENMWRDVEMIKTWKRLDDDNLTKIDEQVLWELQK